MKDISIEKFNGHFNAVFSRVDASLLKSFLLGHISEHMSQHTQSLISIPAYLSIVKYNLTNKEKSLLVHYLSTNNNVGVMGLLAQKEAKDPQLQGTAIGIFSLALPDKFVGTPIETMIMSNQTLISQAKTVIDKLPGESQYYVEEADKHLKNIIENLERFTTEETDKLLQFLTPINAKLKDIHQANNIFTVDGQVTIAVPKQDIFNELEIFVTQNE